MKIRNQKRAERLQRLLDEQGGQCFYCTKQFKSVYANELTVDHIVPKKVGGKDGLYNTVVCCKRCNQIKGHYYRLADLWALVSILFKMCFNKKVRNALKVYKKQKDENNRN